MNKVGGLIQEAIELMECGASEKAFGVACAALKETLKKSLETENVASGDYYNFVKKHWRLLAFMGLPRALPVPLDVDYKLKTILHGFNISGAEELTLHLVRQTAMMNQTPVQFKFHPGAQIEIRGSHIFVPASLIGALVGIVIFQPVNRDETVPEQFWINVSDFKMFVSEFWGRIDLAERILNFYSN